MAPHECCGVDGAGTLKLPACSSPLVVVLPVDDEEEPCRRRAREDLPGGAKDRPESSCKTSERLNYVCQVIRLQEGT